MSNLNFLHSGGNKVTLSAPDSNPSSDVTLKLPQSDGSAGQVLQTDGNGNLSWVSQPTNTPAFSVYRNGTQSIAHNTYTKVQYNIENFDTDNEDIMILKIMLMRIIANEIFKLKFIGR